MLTVVYLRTAAFMLRGRPIHTLKWDDFASDDDALTADSNLQHRVGLASFSESTLSLVKSLFERALILPTLHSGLVDLLMAISAREDFRF